MDDETSVPEMSDDEKRRDQLLRAAGSVEADAAPRITVSEHDGVTRIDIADTAAVRPGLPDGLDAEEDD
ncbi:hypothetical protein QL996_05275 [Planococcus sp. APC 4015]|nr:hypothetical protein [Planococcus sp. APC 4015]